MAHLSSSSRPYEHHGRHFVARRDILPRGRPWPPVPFRRTAFQPQDRCHGVQEFMRDGERNFAQSIFAPARSLGLRTRPFVHPIRERMRTLGDHPCVLPTVRQQRRWPLADIHAHLVCLHSLIWPPHCALRRTFAAQHSSLRQPPRGPMAINLGVGSPPERK